MLYIYLKVFYQTEHVKVLVLLENVEADFFLCVLQNVLEVLEQVPDDVLVLVQHPVPLLVVFLALRQVLKKGKKTFDDTIQVFEITI